jgi:hypothetical protein
MRQTILVSIYVGSPHPELPSLSVWRGRYTWLTSWGPVRSSNHSGADSFMRSRGSIQDTAKYIEMDIVCKMKQFNFTRLGTALFLLKSQDEKYSKT